MKAIIATSLCALALAACVQPQPQAGARLDATGTYYEDATPAHPVNESWRNSTTNNDRSDRMSGRYPVGSTPDSNPH